MCTFSNISLCTSFTVFRDLKVSDCVWGLPVTKHPLWADYVFYLDFERRLPNMVENSDLYRLDLLNKNTKLGEKMSWMKMRLFCSFTIKAANSKVTAQGEKNKINRDSFPKNQNLCTQRHIFNKAIWTTGANDENIATQKYPGVSKESFSTGLQRKRNLPYRATFT